MVSDKQWAILMLILSELTELTFKYIKHWQTSIELAKGRARPCKRNKPPTTTSLYSVMLKEAGVQHSVIAAQFIEIFFQRM